MNEQNSIQPVYLDEKLQSPQMRALKAAIPFMEPSDGKRIALLIKLMELKRIMDSFETDIAVETDHMDRGSRMLEAMRPHCGEEMLKAADFIERAAEMRRMFEFMGAFAGANTPDAEGQDYSDYANDEELETGATPQ